MSAVLFLSVMGFYAWKFINNPCEAEAVEYSSTLLVTQMRRYDDVYISATNGTRTSIDYPITILQQIRMDTQDVEVPACVQTAKRELVGYMDDVIRALQAFSAGESDAAVGGYLDESVAHIRVFITELEEVKDCAPFCLP